MPIAKVKGGYRYGKHGKVYKQRSKAVKQGRAIAISKLRTSGHMNKKGQKNNMGMVLLGILVIAGVFFFMNISGNIKADAMIEIRMYDSNNNLIKQSNMFSVVNNVPNVASIDLTVNAKNTGNINLSCDITSLTPTALNSAMEKSTKIIPIGGSSSWTTSKITVTSLESTSPVSFAAGVTCKYTAANGTLTTLPVKSGSLSVTITPDIVISGNFEVTVTSGNGTSTQGNGTSTSGVQFRTSDTTYATGSAIAYVSSSCGIALTGYGYSTSGTSTSSGTTSCLDGMPSRGTLMLNNLPGGFLSGGANPSLWWSGTAGKYYVCDDNGGNQYAYKVYIGTTTLVSTSPTSIDSTKEVAC